MYRGGGLRDCGGSLDRQHLRRLYVNPDPSGLLEPDLPVPEDGEDLLGRRELVESVVSTILLEAPAIVAVTGRYGDGKTSFLNLAIGELNKSEEIKLPDKHCEIQSVASAVADSQITLQSFRY